MTLFVQRASESTSWMLCLVATAWLAQVAICGEIGAAQSPPEWTVKHCQDFEVTGQGTAAAWQTTEWVPLQRRPQAVHDYTARFKILYSQRGIYVLFDGSDQRLTATLREDFADLWTEDVYECFFWPDESNPLYFEYEISPLGYELPILIPNMDGDFLGWRPWHYERERKTVKGVSARGGNNTAQAAVTGWRAEVFIPYELLKPLKNVPPHSGARWRANFYRVDYDPLAATRAAQPAEAVTQWDWARVGPSFHEYQKFGTLIFE